MKLAARLICFLFFVISFLFFVAPGPVKAQDYAPNTNPDVPKNLHTYSQNVFIEVSAAAVCQLIGIDPVNPDQACLGIDPTTKKIGFVKNSSGVVGLLGNMIAMTLTPPIHTSDYVQYISQNFGIAKPAYAQYKGGYGFNSLNPMVKLWAGFRDIVYMLFTALFVIVGFAIMLRIKIDPRTVMTIQNQIPRLIIGLLLVTFSFAIVGLLIDLMYVGIYVSFNIFSNEKLLTHETVEKTYEVQKSMQGDNPFGILSKLVTWSTILSDSAGGVKDIVNQLFTVGINPQTFPKDSASIPVVSGIKDLVQKGFDFVRNGLAGLLALTAGLLAYLIIAVALVWAMFRLWFQLITAYVYTLINTVLAPFWIIGGVIPGSPVGFGPWMREMIAEISAFPVTIIMFLMGKSFMEMYKVSSGVELYKPPLIGSANQGRELASLIGLGIILMTPQVVSMIKEMLHAPQFKYTAGIGQAIGMGPGVVSGALHAATNPYGMLAAYAKLSHGRGMPAPWAAMFGVAKNKGNVSNVEDPNVTPQPGQATQKTN